MCFQKPPRETTTRAPTKTGAAPRRPRRALACFYAAAGGLGVMAAIHPPERPSLVWNASPSLPVGLYRVAESSPERGAMVALSPTGLARQALDDFGVLPYGRLLLKRVAGMAGDVVCRTGDGLTINGHSAGEALRRDRKGRLLPGWNGCIRLSAQDVFVLGDHPASFDSRYFGAVPLRDVVGVIAPVATISNSGGAS